jgi:hypothetical protein
VVTITVIEQPLQISFNDEPGHQESSPQNPSTVATLISATAIGGIRVIESRLQITASIQNLISTITCRINSEGSTYKKGSNMHVHVKV